MSARVQVDKYFAALERLKVRKKPINNDAVALEAGCGVHGIAEHGVLALVDGTDFARDRLAGVDADTNRDVFGFACLDDFLDVLRILDVSWIKSNLMDTVLDRQ